MNISGTLSDSELLEYIGLKLKLETIREIANSDSNTALDRVTFIKMFLKED